MVGYLPVVDLSDPHALTLVGDACKSWGVFQVINHDVPVGLLEAVEDVGRNLFALPSELKEKATRPPDGFSGFGQPRIAPFFYKQMRYEGFTILGSPLELVSKLWPEDEYCTKFWLVYIYFLIPPCKKNVRMCLAGNKRVACL